jgi:hypothetical protein
MVESSGKWILHPLSLEKFVKLWKEPLGNLEVEFIDFDW